MAEKFEKYAPFFTTLKGAADEANAARTKYKDLTKNSSEAIQGAINDSDNEDLVKFRAFRDQATAKIAEIQAKLDEATATANKIASTLVKTADASEVEAAKSAYLDARAAARKVSEAIKALLSDEEAFKAGVEHYGIVEVVGLGTNSTTTGASGIVRKRLATATVDGKPFADSNGKVTFTNLATHLKADGQALRDAAAKSANVESVRDIPAGASISFAIVVGDKTHQVTITTPEAEEDSSADVKTEDVKSEETPAE